MQIFMGNYCQDCGTYLAPETAMGSAQYAYCLECQVKRLNQYVPEWSNLGNQSGYRGTVIKSMTERIKSDGGKTDYYRIPEHATELRHLISHKAMSKSRGDIFKACYRLGEKEGTDVLYDLNKMKFFIEDLIEMHKRGEHL